MDRFEPPYPVWFRLLPDGTITQHEVRAASAPRTSINYKDKLGVLRWEAVIPGVSDVLWFPSRLAAVNARWERAVGAVLDAQQALNAARADLARVRRMGSSLDPTALEDTLRPPPKVPTD